MREPDDDVRPPALVLRDLRKSFAKTAVDGLNLTVRVGELYALLGPNGAGKTTTLRIVAGLLPPDSGDIAVFGVDARRRPIEAKRIMAWLPDEPTLYDKLDPLEYLEFVAGLWGVEPRRAQNLADELLETLGLWEHRRERCEGFSRGMKQKLALAGALVHEPSLLMLDEPLTGLDAAIARQVKDLLAARVKQGRDDHSDDAYPGGRRTARRPHRHHPARPADRRRHARPIARRRRPRRGEPRRDIPSPHCARRTRRMKLQAGSLVWLAAHDLRQSWRGFEAALGGLTRAKAAMLVCVILALHALFWWARRHFGEAVDDARLSPYIALGVLFVLPGVVAQAVTAATRTLYAHGDLDLLLASPVSARAVLGSKAVAIAANAIAWFAILLLPLANVNALAGHLHWLAVYPALLACGLFGSGIGIGLALALFAAVGPRRARVVSQIAAAAVGASFMLGLQGYAIAPGARASLAQAVQSAVENPWLDWRGWLSLPARAAAGDIEALAAWMIVAAVVFAAAAFGLGDAFARAAIVSAGAPAPSARQRKARPFRGSLGATMRSKERRLILRDPWLISQIVLQVVYMAPVSLVLWRNGGADRFAGRRLRAADRRGRRAARRFARLARAFGRGCARSVACRAGQPGPDRAAQARGDSDPGRDCPLRAGHRTGVGIAVGRLLGGGVRARRQRVGGAAQPLAPIAGAAQPGVAAPLPVEGRRDDRARPVDRLGGRRGDGRHGELERADPGRGRLPDPAAEPVASAALQLSSKRLTNSSTPGATRVSRRRSAARIETTWP